MEPSLHVSGYEVEGYACLFGVLDLGRDMVMPGAFAASLAQRGAAGVRLLYQHDPAEPLGVWTDIAEDTRGLHVRGRLSPHVARARECAALIEEGALDGLSIGFKAVEAAADPRTRVRRISRIDLWEVSIVTFPMQPGARVALSGLPGGRPASDALLLRRAAARLRGALSSPFNP